MFRPVVRTKEVGKIERAAYSCSALGRYRSVSLTLQPRCGCRHAPRSSATQFRTLAPKSLLQRYVRDVLLWASVRSSGWKLLLPKGGLILLPSVPPCARGEPAVILTGISIVLWRGRQESWARIFSPKAELFLAQKSKAAPTRAGAATHQTQLGDVPCETKARA